MNDRLTATIVLYALALAAAAAVPAARGRTPGSRLAASLTLLELVLLVQAAIAAIALTAGHCPAEPATHSGYLAASVLLLPVSAGYAVSGRSRWDALVLAATCLALAVVAMRLHATWPPAGA